MHGETTASRGGMPRDAKYLARRYLFGWSVSLPLVVSLLERVSFERIDPLPLELDEPDLPEPIDDELLCTPSFWAVSEFKVPVAERLLAL